MTYSVFKTVSQNVHERQRTRRRDRRRISYNSTPNETPRFRHRNHSVAECKDANGRSPNGLDGGNPSWKTRRDKSYPPLSNAGSNPPRSTNLLAGGRDNLSARIAPEISEGETQPDRMESQRVSGPKGVKPERVRGRDEPSLRTRVSGRNDRTVAHTIPSCHPNFQNFPDAWPNDRRSLKRAVTLVGEYPAVSGSLLSPFT